jgi:hypothetical protein
MNVLHAARSRKSLASSNNTATSSSKAGETQSARRGAASINLYNDVPSFELSLDEFEMFAIKRLKVCNNEHTNK